MEELGQLISNYGIVPGLLIGMIVGVYLLGRYVLRRLFDEEKGILTKSANKHIEFVDTVCESNKAATASLREIEHRLRANNETLESVHDHGARAVASLRGLLRSAEAVTRNIDILPEETRAHVRATIQQALDELDK